MLKPRNNNYDQFLSSEKQLTNYLQYIRYKKKPLNITIDHPSHLEASKNKENKSVHLKPSQVEVEKYVRVYVNLLREISALDNYATKKIFKSTLHFLEEFPTMNFLYEVMNAFGKIQKKLSMNEATIMVEATDQMVPLFQKIIEKIEYLKKESESKKLMELGHRIEHLQDMIQNSRTNFATADPDIARMFRRFEPDRVDKYVMMEDSITKAEKRFGSFSQNFVKNREIFSNLNRVYEDIRNHQKEDY